MSRKKAKAASIETDWPLKAYKNLPFLSSPEARAIRMLCEYAEPAARFEELDVRDTIVFFGSSRTLPRDVAQANLRALEARGAAEGKDSPELEERLKVARRDLEMSRYYEEARELARRLTTWAQSIPCNGNRFAVCGGGGPGIMEAANRGASEAGGPTVGLNISLPMEQEPNAYQTRELMFEFHYFFMRKFWFVYLARALVAFPGGFGTMDELFELLTLRQTRKIHHPVPIIVYGRGYWDKIINFDRLVELGTISPEDRELFHFFDDVDSAFEFLHEEISRHYLGDE